MAYRTCVLIAILLMANVMATYQADDATGDAAAEIFLATHAPVRVESDTEMSAFSAAEGLKGTGTRSDPYVMGPWSINGSSSGYCIMIKNVTYSIRITKCDLWGPSGTEYDPMKAAPALDLDNDADVRIDNSTMSFSSSGVRALSMPELDMADCLFMNLSWGIYSADSSPIVRDSRFVNITRTGVLTRSCSALAIADNGFLDCFNGISLTDTYQGAVSSNLLQRTNSIQIGNSRGLMISGNTVNDTEGTGFWIQYLTDSTFKDNIASKDSYGFYLSSCTDIEFANNSALDCSGDGISIYDGERIHIENGTIDTNQMGIYIVWSNDIDVSNATVRFQFRDGISIQTSTRVRLSGNRITHGLSNGITASSANYLEIEGNTLYRNNANGVSLTRCRNSIISGNDIDYHSYGIFLDRENLDRIEGNVIRGNSIGIYGLTTGNGTFIDNRVDDSGGYGISFNGCADNALRGNVISRSRSMGFYALSSTKNVISGNAFLENNGVTLTLNASRVQASASGGRNQFNGTSGNYWRDHTSPDVNGDGFVDQPYPVGGPDDDKLPLAIPPFPVIPTSVQNVSCRAVKGTVELAWAAPAMDGGAALTGYTIYRTESGTQKRYADVKEGVTYFTDGSVIDGKRYSYQVSAENIVGEGVLSKSVSCISDGSPPSISITSPRPGTVTGETTVVVEWSAEGDPWETSPPLFDVHLDGALLKQGYNRYSLKVGPLSDGEHVFAVTASDPSENTNESATSFIIDTQAPLIVILDPANGTYSNRTEIEVACTLTEAGTEIISATYYVDAGYKHPLNGSRVIVGLGEGRHVLYVEATDLAGNRNEARSIFFTDLTPPAITVLEPAGPAIVAEPSILISLDCTDALSGIDSLRYSLNDGPAVLLGRNSTFLVTDLQREENVVVITATDIAGNSDSTSVDIYFDDVQPFLTSYGPAGSDEPVTRQIWALFSEEMNKSSVRFLVSDLPGGLAWTGDQAVFNPFDSLEYGRTYEVSVRGKDLAGNEMDEVSWDFTTTVNGSVKGTVLDPDRNALEGAQVEIAGQVRASTNAKGEFSLDLPAGHYDLKVLKSGYSPQVRGIDVSPGDKMDLGTIFLTRLVPSGTAQGRVVDGDGEGILGVLVISDTGEEETTDGDGAFSITLSPGHHRLSLKRESYINRTIEVTITDGNITDLGEITLERVPGSEDGGEGIPLLYLQVMVFGILIILGVVVFLILVRSRRNRPFAEE